MVQLKVLSGREAGRTQQIRYFPWRIGRAPSADLRLEGDGVWPRHIELDFAEGGQYALKSHPQALTFLNSRPARREILRNGDIIELGSLKLQFWLGDVEQADFRIREWATWIGFAAVCLLQIAIVYWLIS